VKSPDRLSAALESAADGPVVIVDLNGRTYDGVDAIRAASTAGATVLAVGQHEDLALRRRALAAGARRVFSYNKLFSDGPRVIGALLRGEL
jgi:DNA-binding NarL/FixJ family response regulator